MNLKIRTEKIGKFIEKWFGDLSSFRTWNYTDKGGSQLALLQPGCWTRSLPVELSYNHTKTCIQDCLVLPLVEIMA